MPEPTTPVPAAIPPDSVAVPPPPAPFMIPLAKHHTVELLTLAQTEASDVLQYWLDAGNDAEYERALTDYEAKGVTFSRKIETVKGVDKEVVYETAPAGQKIDVTIMLQVKGHSINWYFWTAPKYKDRYPQEFRDKLYLSAAQCHGKVDRGCSLYYRGSNAIHLKSMHYVEAEAHQNHNHYRMADNKPVEPFDLNQHLQAFKTHEVHDLFFQPGEVDRICDKFQTFYKDWNDKGVDGKQKSKQEQLASHPSQQFNDADIFEFRMFGRQQEPCRLNIKMLTGEYERERKRIEQSISTGHTAELIKELEELESEYEKIRQFTAVGGSRGLGAARSEARQIEGSKYTAYPLSDDVGIDAPVFPSWAQSARTAQAEAMVKALNRVSGMPSDGKALDVTSTSTQSNSPTGDTASPTDQASSRSSAASETKPNSTVTFRERILAETRTDDKDKTGLEGGPQ